jgi:hypothetical protein
MAKNKGLLIAAGLGALALGAVALQKKPGDLVKGSSGKTWRVVMLSNVGGLKTYEVFAPEASFGPHPELSVLRYSQQDANTASRKVTGAANDIPPQITQTAAADFGLTL